MNTKLCTLALGLCLFAECDAQESKPGAAVADIFAEAAKQREEDAKERVAEREKAVAALRADLAVPWTSVIVAHDFECSCMGSYYNGFCLRRTGGALTVEPWREIKVKERTGDARPIAQAEVERLLSETVLFYLAALRSETPGEKAGPMPGDRAKEKEWVLRYMALGGKGETGDQYGIEVRVVTPDGVTRHSNVWEGDCPRDFAKWITAFGTLPER